MWTATSGTGVPLLLCHGGPGGYDYLEPVAALVDHLAHVHRYDQRGGGRSTPDGPPRTVAALVEDMEALRRRFGHERWLVGGHSWGAHLALFYALAHPERTLGLILLNGTGIRWGWGAERRAARMPRLTPRERAEVEELEARDDEVARERLREVEEETGMRCRLGKRLGDTHYRDRHDRPKLVQWWAMEAGPDAGEFTPNNEVSELEWLPPEDARDRLLYERDRELVTEVEEGR